MKEQWNGKIDLLVYLSIKADPRHNGMDELQVRLYFNLMNHFLKLSKFIVDRPADIQQIRTDVLGEKKIFTEIIINWVVEPKEDMQISFINNEPADRYNLVKDFLFNLKELIGPRYY